MRPEPRSRLRLLGFALLLGGGAAAALGAARPAAADEPVASSPGEASAAWARATARLLAELLEVADAAHAGRLFGVRDEAYLRVLDLEPQHALALKRLKFVRGPAGAWAPPPRFKPGPNLTRVGLEEARARLAAALHGWAAQAEELHPHLPPAEAGAALERVLGLAPEAPAARRLNEEVPDPERPGAWLLAETPPGRVRRQALVEAARAALAAAPAPVEARPTREEAALGVAWAYAGQGPRVRVLGTVARAELETEARLAHAAFDLYAAAFGREPPPLERARLLVLEDPADRDRLLGRWPDLPPKDRDWYARLQSFWLRGSTTLAIVARDEARRREWAARQPLLALLRSGWGVDGRAGWAYEGLSLYLGWTLSGERQTYLVRRTGYAEARAAEQEALWRRLGEPGTDWFAEARAALGAAGGDDLALLLGKPVETMDARDRLLSFALWAWLIEARPAVAVAWLADLKAARDAPAPDLIRRLGTTPALLAARLARWLGERGAGS